MTGSLLLGVDIGTSSSKGVLCTPEGEVLKTSVVPHETAFPRPGWAEHDAEVVWWGEFVTICQDLLSDRRTGADVGAVAVSAIGPCMLPVGTNNAALRPGILYGIDSRAQSEIAQLENRFGIDPMFELNGMRLTSQAIGPKILWLRNHEPAIFNRTSKIHSASSWMVLKLTGEHVIDRHTASYFVPLFDVHRGDWSSAFAEGICEPELLPRLLDACDIAGVVTSNAAEITGLTAGTPVTVGTIDACAEAIGVGVVDTGDMMAMYGSTLFLINLVDRPRPDPRMWTATYGLSNIHAITGSLTSAGLLTAWFRNEIAQDAGDDAYSVLGDRAAEVPAGADGLVCLPYFAGERTPLNDPDARGLYAGLTLRHTQSHLYRALLEGIALGFRHNLDVMTKMGADPRRIVAVGGGTRHPAWPQIMSDVTGRPQTLPAKRIGASYGDAFLAGLASGIIPDLSALLSTWVTVDRVVEPDLALQDFYSARFEIFRELYLATSELTHRLAAQ